MHRIILISALALFLLGGTALADYQPGQDITLSATVAPQLLRTSGTTGARTFAGQEQAHNFLTRATGQSVDHSYIWVQLNGHKVLAVDPVCVYTTR